MPTASLTEAGPYEDPGLPYMNFECPDCGFSLCEWTVCPDCGWYDEDVWKETMEEYVECAACAQTIPESDVHLCDDCRDDFHVLGSPEEGRRVLEEEFDLGGAE